MSPLHPVLRRVRRRLGVQQWLHFTMVGLFAASLVACVWLLLTRLFPVLGDALPVSWALWGVGFAAAAVFALLKRPDLMEAALTVDLRLGLRERVTSSLELTDVEGPMVAAVHQDAEQHARNIDVRRDFPLKPTRLMRWFMVPLLLFGVGYVLLPEFDLLGHREREAKAKVEAEKLEVRAKKLVEAARAVRPPESALPEGLDAAALELEQIAEQLQQGTLSEKQALAKVANLSEKLAQQREQLQEKQTSPRIPGETEMSSVGKGIARDMENGRPADAAKKLQDLKKQLKEGELSEEQKRKLAKDLKLLAKMLGGDNPAMNAALADALADAGETMDGAGMEAALEAMELSLEDLASALEQLAKLDMALAQLGEWRQEMMGPSDFCRFCGKALKPCKHGKGCKGCGEGHCCTGYCSACAGLVPGAGMGLGMGGPGRGAGNRVGDLPDEEVGFKPTMLPGKMSDGKLLANILQKGAPEVDAEATVEVIGGVIVEAQQEAEQALTKEEIPRGSKEFVRQYFGSLEPQESAPQESRGTQTGGE